MKVIKTTLLFLIIISQSIYAIDYAAAENEAGCTVLREVDKGTFGEYCYKITQGFFDLKKNYEIDGVLSTSVLNNLKSLTEESYKFLPSDNLYNTKYQSELLTAIEKGIKYPNNNDTYSLIVESIQSYLGKVSIQAIKGYIEASPEEGNAPLTVTFRGRVEDPSGTKLSQYNMQWYIDNGGTMVNIGKGSSINYTFKEEGTFSVFLEVKSNHRNKEGNIDVLPFYSKKTIEVKEKLASLIVKVNDMNLRNSDTLKFTPEEGRYGLVFDATSSTPASGTKFKTTTWDFGNGIEREYEGAPKVERVIYASEGEYNVILKLKTNELRTIERKFTIYVHKPIASINVNKEEGYLGDKFTFSARNASQSEKNLNYYRKIIDIENDEIIYQKGDSTFTYTFSKKGKYNVQLITRDPGGYEDMDSRIIFINSRPPEAVLNYSIPKSNKPNTVLLDASESYDPDYSDEGKLQFRWTIDGQSVNLTNPNDNGSVGEYTFTSIGDHSVVLEVIDPDGISALDKEKIKVASLLDLDFSTYPRVIQRNGYIRFVADSKNARFFEWDFSDGDTEVGNSSKVNHQFIKSGIFEVKLTVRDSDGNTNSYTKPVYVGESDRPYAFIGIDIGSGIEPPYDDSACGGAGAYIVDRVNNIMLTGKDSINVDGTDQGLDYSWKIGNDRYVNTVDSTHKFDELGCFPIKLTVQAEKERKMDSKEIMVEVRNLKPKVKTLSIDLTNPDQDPVIINVKALGAEDPDGVIQSYLWYYYTDIDHDPQDFRATMTPDTTFVLPKVTGNYYFVVVMKDNNEEKIDSETVTGAKFFTTLSGDNINTPLIDFSVDNSSIYIGDKVNFKASVKNILGQDITKSSTYFWDFDGDGFYDQETDTPNISHEFSTSGQFYVKLKARYKGMSNVRTLEVNVSNKLIPDFDYLSIGNKIILVDKSSGKIDNITWDLGDENERNDKKVVIYNYLDDKIYHNVNLKITEGTKVKDVTKKVFKNKGNEEKISSDGLHFFTFPALDSDKGSISIKSPEEKIYIYTGESKGNFTNYGIDIDLSNDSDINGEKDDDIDNKFDNSYNDGSPFLIPLNDKRIQEIRIFLLSEDGEVVSSEDIKIIKTYIKEETIDPATLDFRGVSEKDKLKIEKLKNFITTLPQEYRLDGMKKLEKLQSEWNDDVERTKTILELEYYIAGLDGVASEDIINLLESFLVEGEEEQNVKNMSINVVKGLIPKTLEGYEEIIIKLDSIKDDNLTLEENKILGSEILKYIADTDLISVDDKLTIKSQLQVAIYEGQGNIPEEEIEKIVKDESESSFSMTMIGILKKLLFFVLGFIGIFIGVIVLFYIYYLISNKNKNFGFQDFIIEKTSQPRQPKQAKQPKIKEEKQDLKKEEDIFSNKKEEKKSGGILDQEISSTMNVNDERIEETPNMNDPFGGIGADDISSTISKKEGQAPDWLAGANSVVKSSSKSSFLEENDKENNEDITDPLANTSNNDKFSPENDNSLKSISEEENNSDWLKSSFEDNGSESSISKDEDKKEADINLDELTKIEEEKTPDWLKGSFEDNSSIKDEKSSSSSNEEKKEEKREKVNQDKETKKEENKEVDKKPDDEEKKESKEKIPDWLKGSFEDNSSIKDEKSSSSSNEEKNEEKKQKANQDKDTKKEEIKEVDKKPDNEEKKESKEKIPDWLKGSFEDNSSIKDKKSSSSSNEEKNEEKKEKANQDKETKKEEIKEVDKKPDNEEKKIEKEASEKTKKTEIKEAKIEEKEDNLVEKTTNKSITDDKKDLAEKVQKKPGRPPKKKDEEKK